MNKKKLVLLGDEAISRLVNGVNVMADAISKTLGPKGKHAMILTSFDTPHITKDGVTVARAIKLEDPVENLGAQAALQAAEKTVREAGDGTTTAIILTRAIIREARKLIAFGIDPRLIRDYLQNYFSLAVDYIRSVSVKIDTLDQVSNVAMVSSNRDKQLAKLVTIAYEKVGLDGIITTAESKTATSWVDVDSGLRFSRGYVSPLFVNCPRSATVEYSSPLVFITDGILRTSRDAAAVLNIAAEKSAPILIIADDIQGQALATILLNRHRASMPVVAVKAPSYGQNRYDMLEDIAAYTGATVVSESKGMLITDITESALGSCDRIVVSSTDTTIIGPKGSKQDIEARIESIKGLIDTANHSMLREQYLERMAMLKGHIATIYVGGRTDLEVKELKDRLDDTIHATRAAIDGGVIPSTASTLYKVYHKIESSLENKHPALQAALEAIMSSPLECLCDNCGVSVDIVKNSLNASPDISLGYNALTDKVENLYDAGIIDPALVLMSALNNSLSVASLLLSTEVVVTQPSLSSEDIASM